MSDPVLKLQLLLRSELALAQIRAERLAGRSALFAVAMVFALLMLGMLNFAGFYAMNPSQGPAVAALIVALVDAAIMAAVLLIARNVVIKQNEEKLACEMRDLAHGELNRDIEKAKADLEQVSHDVRTIRSSLVTFSGAAASTLTPLLGLLVKAVKKR